VRALVEIAHHEEEGARQDAVVEHDEHGALHARGVVGHGDGGEDAGGDEAHVADARIGDELLEVLLHERDRGPVEDGDHGQARDQRHEVDGRVGEERQAEAQHAVGAHLQQHAGQDHRPCRRRLDVGVGQPRVQWEHRHLDGEGQEEGEEGPELQVVRVDDIAQGADVEGQPRALVVDVPHDGDDGDEHEQAAHEGEQHELDRRVDLPRPAPDADDEVHRDEHGLPEHVEQDEVGGAEHARHARLQQQQRDEEAHLAVLDVVPAPDDHDEPQERGQ